MVFNKVKELLSNIDYPLCIEVVECAMWTIDGDYIMYLIDGSFDAGPVYDDIEVFGECALVNIAYGGEFQETKTLILESAKQISYKEFITYAHV